jgi:ERF superfamily
MNQSESITALAKALIAFQADVGAIPKTSTNPFFKSKYAGLPIVVETAQVYLTKHKLAVTQGIDLNDTLTTRLIHESGEWIEAQATLHLVKDDPQAHGSAVTYGRRYGYMAILGLVADEDDDGNKGSGKGKDGEKKHEEKKSDERPLSPLWAEIKDDLKYQALGDGKGQFLEDTVGHPVASPKELSDDDCAQIIAKLKTQ